MNSEPTDQRLRTAFARERRRQLRGLLWLGALVLSFILWRANTLGVFHAGWWRP